jgi:hypothetical protein
MDCQRNWLEENDSDDSHGRALWALGAESTRAFLHPLLELRLAENIDQPDEHSHNEQLSIGNLSSLQTHLYPDSRELAVSGK